MPIISQNPATEEILKKFDELTTAQLEAKLALARTTYESWRHVSFADRAKVMRKAAEILKKEARHYGEIISKEIGKPIKAATAEVEKCAWVCEYYADNAEKMLSNQPAPSDASESYVAFEPLGVVLAVMPWNFPFWQVFRFAAPALMAGNVGLLKHASNVPQSAEAIEEIFLKAGVPKGAFQNLLVGSSKVEGIIRDPRVMAATLTGSEYAGQQVASQAGSEIKKTVLELGGSDPFIVLKDADIEKAASMGTTARLQNAGQSCIAAKRFIVEESIAKKFLAKFKENFEKIVIGDPSQEATQLGTVATRQILQEIDDQVKKSIAMGAKLITGGHPRDGKGYFYLPTILANVKKGMPAYDQETFGPVAAVISVKNEDEAIQVANDTPFGLGSSLWTRNAETAKRLIPKIQAGCVFVNGMVKSDPRLPFGGIKRSGYGRELAEFGIKEFVNVKTVWIA